MDPVSLQKSHPKKQVLTQFENKFHIRIQHIEFYYSFNKPTLTVSDLAITKIVYDPIAMILSG